MLPIVWFGNNSTSNTNKQKELSRFLVVSRAAVNSPENNKASVCFELTHQPGSLVDVLAAFKK
jgi:prephenate dehydratase